MKRKLLYLLSFLLLNFLSLTIYSQSHSLYIKGVVTYIDDTENALNSSIIVGDTIYGTITYDLSCTDNNTLPEVADYWYYNTPNGIDININGYTFKTDPDDVNFLFEVIDNHNNRDNLLFRSYANVFPEDLPVFTDTHISWQLDDATQTALDNTDIQEYIELSAWEQDFGLSVRGSTVTSDTSFSIKSDVFYVDTVNIFSSINDQYYRDVKIFPNPATDMIKIDVAPELMGAGYVLTDQAGRTVMRGKLEGTVTGVDIRKLPAGIYFIKIDQAETFAFKLMKR